MSDEHSGANPYYQQPQAGAGYPGYQNYGAGQVPFGPPPDHPEATKILILGILGFAVCQLTSPFAWGMGNRVKREIEASNGTLGGAQYVQIGRILGIVGSVLLIGGLLLFLAYLAIIVAVAVG